MTCDQQIKNIGDLLQIDTITDSQYPCTERSDYFF